jgi:hypothetical protein
MTQRADDACALHIFGDGQQVGLAAIRGHIAGCAQSSSRTVLLRNHFG